MNWSEQHPAIIEAQMIVACNDEKLSEERLRPCNIKPVRISKDGDSWCVFYGENLQDGVAGWGKSPEDASKAFDIAWLLGTGK